MEILLDNYSGVPIYEQIFTQIKEQILDGRLKADDPLPSIRNLAKDLRISVITTKRAYRRGSSIKSPERAATSQSGMRPSYGRTICGRSRRTWTRFRSWLLPPA